MQKLNRMLKIVLFTIFEMTDKKRKHLNYFIECVGVVLDPSNGIYYLPTKIIMWETKRKKIICNLFTYLTQLRCNSLESTSRHKQVGIL